ncbi:class I SAM-dependent methyltransferase [Methylococcus sp. EFPC2]|uniref:class I SAM-dependent methyltransferase n=1 Tax=Methylococcus sp. EFPC2 TaxID=2812648 RepID=UPI0019674B01|nr:class I SAM-dependent methyltransferase [Methylococcus sp. EFPC2]QSA96585.1 class I SAM-dependent methyltransferase [Methylococcus sp. EFPC2]
MPAPDCPLCHRSAEFYTADLRRSYFRCPDCGLVYADPASQLSPSAEKAVYDLHDNDPDDAGYRRFLGRLLPPLLERVKPGMEGLDYGCGPGPALARMLEEAGMPMVLYDPHYRPDSGALERTYDFVTCTETVEHFRRPAEDWTRLAALLKPGAWLAVMTQPVISRERFERWQYKNDPTHLAFYSAHTLRWLAERLGLASEQAARDIFLFKKPGPA